jgi:hypothetical protein
VITPAIVEDQAMRRPRVRFTVRHLMAAVAVAALLLAARGTWRRYQSYRYQAATYAEMERLVSALRPADSRISVVYDPGTPQELRFTPEQVSRLRRKYERAAARPWIPVEPEPGPPLPGLR